MRPTAWTVDGHTNAEGVKCTLNIKSETGSNGDRLIVLEPSHAEFAIRPDQAKDLIKALRIASK